MKNAGSSQFGWLDGTTLALPSGGKFSGHYGNAVRARAAAWFLCALLRLPHHATCCTPALPNRYKTRFRCMLPVRAPLPYALAFPLFLLLFVCVPCSDWCFWLVQYSTLFFLLTCYYLSLSLTPKQRHLTRLTSPIATHLLCFLFFSATPYALWRLEGQCALKVEKNKTDGILFAFLRLPHLYPPPFAFLYSIPGVWTVIVTLDSLIYSALPSDAGLLY